MVEFLPRKIGLANIHALLAFACLMVGCSEDAGMGRHDAKALSNSGVVAVSNFDCGVGGGLTVRWAKDLAEVSIAGETRLLPRARSGSGARYSDGTREVWEHQGLLRWTDAEASPVTCHPITKR